MIVSNKKIISKKEIVNSLKLVLSGELLDKCLIEGEKANENIFPHFIVDKVFKSYGKCGFIISKACCVYLAAVLEYITADILDISSNYAKINKHVCITIKDIDLGVRNDVEFSKLFNKLNITLLGSGVIPFIHPVIETKSNDNTITNIKKFQQNDQKLQISLSSFRRTVKALFKNMKINKDVIGILQSFMEQYLVNILRDANFLAIYTNRVKVIGMDIELANIFKNNLKNPYNSFYENNEFIFDIDENINTLIEEEISIEEDVY
jgi:histone H2A